MDRLSEAEELVMREVWRLGRPVATGEMTALLSGDKGWKLQTVSTFLTRLVGKGLLVREKREGQNFYTPAIDEAGYRADQTRQFLTEMHGGSVKNLLAVLYDNSDISGEELAALRRWLEGRARG